MSRTLTVSRPALRVEHSAVTIPGEIVAAELCSSTRQLLCSAKLNVTPLFSILATPPLTPFHENVIQVIQDLAVQQDKRDNEQSSHCTADTTSPTPPSHAPTTYQMVRNHGASPRVPTITSHHAHTQVLPRMRRLSLRLSF